MYPVPSGSLQVFSNFRHTKKEFGRCLHGKLDIYNSEFFRLSCNASEAEIGLADYFFSKGYYDDALDLFLRQVNERPDDAQLYEKIGYCYEEADFFDEALKYYREAELIDRKIWTVRKIAFLPASSC